MWNFEIYPVSFRDFAATLSILDSLAEKKDPSNFTLDINPYTGPPLHRREYRSRPVWNDVLHIREAAIRSDSQSLGLSIYYRLCGLPRSAPSSNWPHVNSTCTLRAAVNPKNYHRWEERKWRSKARINSHSSQGKTQNFLAIVHIQMYKNQSRVPTSQGDLQILSSQLVLWGMADGAKKCIE